jgi:hypothetical protein
MTATAVGVRITGRQTHPEIPRCSHVMRQRELSSR